MENGFSAIHQFPYCSDVLTADSFVTNHTSYEYSEFDNLLRSKWDKAMKDGLFRYKLDSLKTKVISGEKKYVAQLNVMRATERRKPEEHTDLNQAFDPNKFNFTKVKPGEILFELQNKENDKNIKGQHYIMINVSPLEMFHVLLVPDVFSGLPQVLTENSISLAIEVMLLSKHRGFRLGMNSLCAFASVNHLHFHGYYTEFEIYTEHCPAKHLIGPVYILECMPVKAFAFQLAGSSITDLSKTIFSISQFLHNKDIAHNFCLLRGVQFGEDKCSNKQTVRLFLWPRKKTLGPKDQEGYNLACVELTGYFPIKSVDVFEKLTEEDIESVMWNYALEDIEFESLKQEVIKMFSD